MRNTNTIEVVGIGNFKVYPIVEKETEYNKVNKDKQILTKIKIVEGSPSKYAYVDENNNQYADKDVFIDFNGTLVQTIKKTEKVKKFEIVDKTEIYNLTEYNICLLKTDETTYQIFNDKIKDNAIRFTYKKSSVGLNFWRSYIMKINNKLVLIVGKGNLLKAIEDFNSMEKSKKENTEITYTRLEVNADDLEIEV